MNAMKKERIQIAKALGILFGSLTAFYVGYFIWSVAQGETTIYQLISRGTQVAVVAYITYAIHTEIRGRVRYTKHDSLYAAVDSKIKEDKVAEQKTVRIEQADSSARERVRIEHMNVYGSEIKRPPFEQLPDPGRE